eukprot:1141142-Pelagomonas_calceolata.AAC.2
MTSGIPHTSAAGCPCRKINGKVVKELHRCPALTRTPVNLAQGRAYSGQRVTYVSCFDKDTSAFTKSS